VVFHSMSRLFRDANRRDSRARVHAVIAFVDGH
jgi:hypothetical protein